MLYVVNLRIGRNTTGTKLFNNDKEIFKNENIDDVSALKSQANYGSNAVIDYAIAETLSTLVVS